MPNPVKPVPDNFHSITANLVCHNVAQAIDFYKKAFGATETVRVPGPGGKIIHAELKIGDSTFFVGEPMTKTMSAPEPGAVNLMSIYLYVEDVDGVFNRAVAAGARADMALQDMFWGDRSGRITDPFGHQWGIATHKEDVTPEEMKGRQEAFFARAAG
jgi:PhnB protein